MRTYPVKKGEGEALAVLFMVSWLIGFLFLAIATKGQMIIVCAFLGLCASPLIMGGIVVIFIPIWAAFTTAKVIKNAVERCSTEYTIEEGETTRQ